MYREEGGRPGKVELEGEKAGWEGLESKGVGGWMQWCVGRSAPPTVARKEPAGTIPSPLVLGLRRHSCLVQWSWSSEGTRGSAQSAKVGGTPLRWVLGRRGRWFGKVRGFGMVEVGDNILEPLNVNLSQPSLVRDSLPALSFPVPLRPPF